jgi:hypothetical protein
MYQYYVLYLAWWWLSEPKHVAEFLILIRIYIVFIDWINYIIAKHKGVAPIKITVCVMTRYGRIWYPPAGYLCSTLFTDILQRSQMTFSCRTRHPAVNRVTPRGCTNAGCQTRLPLKHKVKYLRLCNNSDCRNIRISVTQYWHTSFYNRRSANERNSISETACSFYFNTLFHASFIILYYDQQMNNYFTNYHTPPTCFDTIVSPSGSSQSVPCQVTQVCQMKLPVI